nr:hypothetical protein GCM10020185_25860 [Pseudomonas brassicacearum subsp. brassicacearum]
MNALISTGYQRSRSGLSNSASNIQNTIAVAAIQRLPAPTLAKQRPGQPQATQQQPELPRGEVLHAEIHRKGVEQARQQQAEANQPGHAAG